jgi:hypothetical protein
VPGIDVQEVAHEEGRLIVLRQRIAERPNADGKKLLEVPGDMFQALRTNLPASVSPLEVWRRYNGRADIENRIKELGTQFSLKGLCCRSFWATEAATPWDCPIGSRGDSGRSNPRFRRLYIGGIA